MAVTLSELIPITSRAVEWLYAAWLKSHIQGLTLERADREAYAAHLALTLLGDLPCACGRNLCAHQHTLAALPTSGKTLAAFVYRAVIGPVGLKTNSIAQGMLFPYLQQEHGLRVSIVAYKQCAQPDCRRRYEGGSCPFCRTLFSPDTTAVVGVEWLVVEGEGGYLPIHYWRCGDGVHIHFYPQAHCRGNGEHGSPHDSCPWQACPAGNPPHGQRGTTLWVRAKFLRRSSEASVSPQVLAGIAKGVQQAMAQCSAWEQTVLRLLGDSTLAIAETLLVDKAAPSAQVLCQAMSAYPEAPTPRVIRHVLAYNIRPKVLQAIRQVYQVYG